jgi:hypothetical protein
MDGDDHDRTPARRGRGRPRAPAHGCDAGLPDGLEGVRRAIALEVVAELLEEWGGESRTVEWLLRELLARLREE